MDNPSRRALDGDCRDSFIFSGGSGLTPVRFLAISPSCVEPVNRALYRRLARHYQLDVHVVIPSKHSHAPDISRQRNLEEPFKLTVLDSRGAVGRMQTLSGLSKLIRSTRPTHVFVEADPASRLMKDSIRPARAVGAEVWAMTAENLTRRYLQEGVRCLVRGDLRGTAAGVITWFLWRSVVHSVDRVFVLSSDAVAAFSQMGFAGRITRIPLGFEPTLFYPQGSDRVDATRARLGLNATTVAYFGRLVPEKGVHLLIEALVTLSDLPWQLLLDRFELYKSDYGKRVTEQIQNSGIAERVVFFDAKHEDMPDYMNAADIVVLPSVTTPKWKEQYGRVIPEAMACGKVVIGSSSGTIPELIGDAGFIFPEGKVEDLANTLRGALTASREELDRLSGRAVDRAHTQLSVEQQASVMFGFLTSAQRTVMSVASAGGLSL